MEKEKASTLEKERLNCHVEEIEVYESSSHEERKKSVQDIEKNEHLLYILPLQIMPTMRQKKKESIFKLFHLQNKTTKNLNLRIKANDFEDTQKNSISIPISNIVVSTTKNIFDVPSKKNWIIDY